MKIRLVGLSLACAASLFAGYTYDYQSSSDYNFTSHWASNGVPGSYVGSSNIYLPAVPGANPNDYELETWPNISSASGTLMHFLRASSSTVQPGVGSYVSVEIDLSGWTPNGSVPLSVNQCTNGVVTRLGGTSVVMTGSLRSIIWGSNLWVFVNNVLQGTYTVTPTTGQPGYGGYNQLNAGSGSVNIGHHDTVAPAAIGNNIPLSLYSSSVSLSWQPTSDDAAGIGLLRYDVWRNGSIIGSMNAQTTVFRDATAHPGTQYTYGFDAVDFHGNVSAVTTISVTTPPNTAIDPRRPGVRSNGAYWGGGGEQIDMLSGNLNFSLPLATAMGRTGTKFPLSLTYNAQNWRQESGVNWRLGGDVGLGFGWRAQIGSITPYYADWTAGVDHYTFTDGSGAEYRLDVNNNGVWSSVQAIYVWFDANTSTLHFKDGTFWMMGSVSGGLEDDAGAMSPTIIEDVNGNQVTITYDTAVGLAYGVSTKNTSSRITAIADARSLPWSCGGQCPPGTTTATYYMTYDRYTYGTTPHLTAFNNLIGTSEAYSFSYATGSMNPPFGPDANYTGFTTTRLTTMTPPTSGAYQFGYDGAGASELAQVTFPYGGHLRWNYQSFQYAGSRTLREVSGRYLAVDPLNPSTEWSYSITHPDAANAVALHTSGTVSGAAPLDG